MRKLLLFLVVVWLAACSTIDCPVENIVSVQYQIRDKAGKELSITDSLTVFSNRQNGDTVVLNRLINKSEFSLPISYSYPEDILFFWFKKNDTIVADTVWMKKTIIPILNLLTAMLLSSMR